MSYKCGDQYLSFLSPKMSFIIGLNRLWQQEKVETSISYILCYLL